MMTANTTRNYSSLNKEAIGPNLPEGWESILLKELVSYKKGKKPKRLEENKWHGAVPYIDIEAFEKQNIRRYSDPDSSVLVDEGDVVVVWDGARCGHVGRIPVHGALGSTLMNIKPIMINPDYLLRYLQMSYETINANPRGTGIPHVEPALFWNLEVPIAPLPEQKRIVAKIEELLVRVNVVRERLTKVKETIKRFRQSVLAAAFSGRLSTDWREKNPDVESVVNLLNHIQEMRKKEGRKKERTLELDSDNLNDLPEKWRYITLSNIATIIMGQSPPGTAYNTKGYGMPLINGPVEFGKGPFSPTLKTKFTTKVTKKCKENDLLICVRGSTTGRTNIAGFEACIGRGVAAIRAELVKQWYLNYHIHSRYEEILAAGTGSTFPNIASSYLETLIIPLPPLLEQEEIVQRIDGLFNLADIIERRVSAAAAQAEKLTESILAKAFRGELVLNEAELARREGRSFEPASVLLNRIRVERELAEAVMSKRRRTTIRKPRKLSKRKPEAEHREKETRVSLDIELSRFSGLKAYKALSENARQLLWKIEGIIGDREFTIERILAFTDFERKELKNAFFELLSPFPETRGKESPFVKMKFSGEKAGYIYRLAGGK